MQCLLYCGSSVQNTRHTDVILSAHRTETGMRHRDMTPSSRTVRSMPEYYQEIVAKIKADLDDVRDDVVGVYQLICK